MANIVIAVTTTAKKKYIHLNGKLLKFDDDGRSTPAVVLKEGAVVPIAWHFVGKSKDTISIEAFVDAEGFWKLEKDSIPADREMGWGMFDLKVPS